MLSGEALARAELRARQGVGARYDASSAPARDLLWARRGTAYLARKINELSDAELDLPGRGTQSRRSIIARIGYQARALARLFECERMATGQPLYDSVEAYRAEIADSATLPAHALRYLFAHSEVHLNVEWRDLPGSGWNAALTDSVLLRARLVWASAVELGNGARYADFPTDMIRAFAHHAARYWQAQDLDIALTLRPQGAETIILGAGSSALDMSWPELARRLLAEGAPDRMLLPPLPDYP